MDKSIVIVGGPKSGRSTVANFLVIDHRFLRFTPSPEGTGAQVLAQALDAAERDGRQLVVAEIASDHPALHELVADHRDRLVVWDVVRDEGMRQHSIAGDVAVINRGSFKELRDQVTTLLEVEA